MIVYTARHLLPVVSPPIQDAALAVEVSRVVAVGRRRDVLKSVKATEVRDLGDVVVMPGLVNAHTHLELSWMAEETAPVGDYVAWVRRLVARRAGADDRSAGEAVSRAIEGMIARGTVGVGDVANGTSTPALLARSPLAGVVFHEVYGFRAADAEGILEAAAARLDTIASDPELKVARDRLTVALTPHAAHTTSGPLLRALGGRAAAAAAPLSI